MYIRMVAPVEVSPLKKCFSKEDWILLDTMSSNPPLGGCSGRFLTMHKRRRKKLATRSLNQDYAILDDIHHGQVQRILDRCGMWGFNAFTLETVAGGRALPVLCVHLFHWYGLLDYFRLDVVRVWKLFTLIEEGYHSTNPYHNSIHATDVTQAMHCFLQEEKIRKHLKPLEVMAALIGAVAHDLDHPGVNQHFLICTSNHLATLYENMSVLENHHWRSAVGCLLESGVAEQLLPYRAELEQQIRDLILATDINRQQEFLTKFKNYLDTGTLDLSMEINRHFILQIALKCADISNPTRPWDISHKWSIKVCDEFFRQGEFERQLNLPVTSICDQQSISVAKIQVGFFRHVVTPLFSEWHRFLKSPLSTHMMAILESNHRRWEKQEKTEAAEETQTELSDADPPEHLSTTSDDDNDAKTPELPSSTATTITDFLPPPSFRPLHAAPRRQSLAVPSLESALGVRRHSVPVNMPADGATHSRTIYRRESFGSSRMSPNESRASSSGFREGGEMVRFGSGSSIVSSTSPHTDDGAPERPLSAENLLPEPSIASITSSTAVGRLSSVLQGGTVVAPASKCLTRQQTFPPPQPYVRMRYMSATVEMSTCSETVHEVGEGEENDYDLGAEISYNSENNENISSSTSTRPPQPQQQQYMIPSIAVLSPNNGQASCIDFIDKEAPATVSSSTSDSNSSNSNNGKKREVGVEDKEEKGAKMVKLSDPAVMKENVDPRRLTTATTLTRRRGSAPVSLPLGGTPDDFSNPAGGTVKLTESQMFRRGSVPIEIAHYYTSLSSYDDDNLEPVINITPVETSRTFWQYQRRGSAPLDLPPSGEHSLIRHTSLNGKSGGASGRRKKQQQSGQQHLLRRRSSGGPETVCLQQNAAESAHDQWTRFMCMRRQSADNPARRRGSLPIEVLTVGHSVF